MKEIIVRVLDFAEYPGPRYKSQGTDSGEEFYLELLKPNMRLAIKDKSKLIIDLDGTAGYAPSFIDESFGNLVYDFAYDDILKIIEVKSSREPDWVELIKKDIYPKWKRKKDEGHPRKPNE